MQETSGWEKSFGFSTNEAGGSGSWIKLVLFFLYFWKSHLALNHSCKLREWTFGAAGRCRVERVWFCTCNKVGQLIDVVFLEGKTNNNCSCLINVRRFQIENKKCNKKQWAWEPFPLLITTTTLSVRLAKCRHPTNDFIEHAAWPRLTFWCTAHFTFVVSKVGSGVF